MIEVVRPSYDVLKRSGSLNVHLKIRLRSIHDNSTLQFVNNTIAEVPDRGPKVLVNDTQLGASSISTVSLVVYVCSYHSVFFVFSLRT